MDMDVIRNNGFDKNAPFKADFKSLGNSMLSASTRSRVVWKVIQ